MNERQLEVELKLKLEALTVDVVKYGVGSDVNRMVTLTEPPLVCEST